MRLSHIGSHSPLCSLLFALLALLGCVACAPEFIVGYAPGPFDDAGIDAALDAADSDAPEPLPEITWMSGGHPGNDLQMYLDFGTWRGRPTEIANLFPDRTSWDGVVSPSWPINMFGPFEGTIVLSLPPYPEGMGNLDDCAAGDYDARWASFGTFMVDRDRADAIVRLGWGPNDTDHDWKVATDASGAPMPGAIETWKACFQRVVSAIRSTNPLVRIDWSFNPIGAPEISTYDPYLTYPGDDFVDFVGLEVFDIYPPVTTDAEWDAACNAPSGLCPLMEFARSHGKRVGIAEWAVASCGLEGQSDPGNVGGDNPFFVQKVVETFADNADVMAYDAYFESTTALCSVINGGTGNPNAAAKYRELYTLR